MNYKRVVVSALLAVLSLFVGQLEVNAIEDLSYELVKAGVQANQEPINYYQLSLSQKTQSSLGYVVIKSMDGQFSDFPVFIAEDGSIQLEDKSEECVFGFGGGYGERFEVLLAKIVRKEAEPIAKCVIIPFPLCTQDENGHYIELKAESEDGKHFSIVGSGFNPKEKITFISRSYDETIEHPITVDAKGEFRMGYAPAVIGKKEGPFEVTFSGKTTTEPLKIRHYWGKIAFCPLNKYKELESRCKSEKS